MGIYCLSLLRAEGEEANVLHAYPPQPKHSLPFFSVNLILKRYRDAAAKESVNVINFDWHDQVGDVIEWVM